MRFDGSTGTLLLEAKSNYEGFVKDDRFQGSFNGADAIVDQARRQIAAANGVPIKWRVMQLPVVNALNALFAANGVKGIKVVHVP